ncbi:nicotinamide-nucleotide amidohydrolase family protein [Marinobacter sp.]|uniref:nicotinamide-nucleotide amidohydrolase family protein n=1 Tax=Marinobacter sp. TaxID=50741 RepID=UPI002B4A56DA|nr:nicotinamide-nucleotide amidohydrolase family protein [Marinobacter sp.]HKK56238.1 nicotinamide-nucleotide amidohydrolase family protein [Marinobacter sp.]
MSPTESAADAALNEAGDQLAEVLLRRRLRMATAESCTGGWVAKILTDRAGSSAYLLAGIVSYSNDAKTELLGVTETSLEAHGAVSEPVVREMVAGALAATGADVAVAVSGVAGPDGGSDDKPVGTVWFAWGRSPADTEAVVEYFSGDRDAVRRQAVLFVLQGVKAYLENG